MPQIAIFRPTDQPTNKVRLINELKLQLACNDLSYFTIVVAFAKLLQSQMIISASEKRIRLTIVIPKQLLERVDKYSEELIGKTSSVRSAVIRRQLCTTDGQRRWHKWS